MLVDSNFPTSFGSYPRKLMSKTFHNISYLNENFNSSGHELLLRTGDFLTPNVWNRQLLLHTSTVDFVNKMVIALQDRKGTSMIIYDSWGRDQLGGTSALLVQSVFVPSL